MNWVLFIIGRTLSLASVILPIVIAVLIKRKHRLNSFQGVVIGCVLLVIFLAIDHYIQFNFILNN